ncbi:MAG: tRNA (adenosine(37)-N6)-threonylcarbamoyltransferase complex dimerization subunit type 1 TsaB [Proteobacteria bacterium]|nr:tRNA (adenosine(37)-N6)-threonylcarbamoyltransferase complex dimerization subunit type 1 TsaB [Pseudomonadota bacterium]
MPEHSEGLLLVIANCEDRLQLVLGEPGRLLASRELVVPGHTVQFLIPAVAEMLAEQERPVQDIARIAITRGPGSFTGIRMALSAAAGIQAGTSARLAGLDHLPLVARGPLALTDLPCFVLTYARKGQVYLQGFEPDGEPMAPLCQLSETQAATRVRAFAAPCTLVGTGLHKNPDAFVDLPNVTLLGPEWSHPSPGLLLAAACQAEYGTVDIDPAYGRQADAEENFEAIAAKRGIGPEEARRLLKESRRS